MTALSIQPPYPTIPDTDGQPLEDGYIWIGTANLNPITNPIAVYWDAALTQPAGLPIRTQGGYPVNSGTPARLYVGSDYSILVQNSRGTTVYSAPQATERYSDPVITGVSSAEVSFLQAGTGAVTRTAQSKMRDIVSVKDFGAVGDGVADDTAAIQAAIDYMESINGGVVQLLHGTYKITSTLQMDASVGVQLIGQGGDGIHDGGTGAAAATTLTWYGSAGGTMLNVSSPVGATNARQFGPSVCDVKLDCRSLAGIGLLVNSVRNGTFSRIYILSPRIAGVKTTTLGNALLAESSDTQRCVFDRISVRAIDDASTRPAHGLWLTSHQPVGSNSNTSLNYFTQCDMQMWGGAGSGYGLFLEDGDNNTFMNLRVFRASATTVEAVRIVGNTNCDANYFWNLSAGGANSITIRGTASGFAINPRKNSFWCTDSGNGTQLPTVDSGVIYFWHNDDNVLKQTMFNQAIIADSQAQALGNYGNIGNASVYVFNGSNNHILLADGTNLWGVSLDSATGDLRLLRLVGSGAVNVGDGSPVKILGKNVTEGAIDSGGVGFKVLRVPN